MIFWTHEKFMDVVADLTVVYQDSKRIKVKISWWNKGYTGRPWPLGVVTKHEIPLDKFRAEWKPVMV